MSADRNAVDVILTCFNEGKYIGAAVRSVLAQTSADRIISIVIADDGSEAETVSVLKDIETWDRRVKVIYGAGGAGISRQRNMAIAEVSSPFIALLDGDDLWHPAKLERQLAAHGDNQEIGLIYSDFSIFPGMDIASARRAGVIDITARPDLVEAYFLYDPPIIPSTVLIRREAYLRAGLFDDKVKVFEDTDFFIRMAKITRFGLVNEALLLKRVHQNSITGSFKNLMGHHAMVAFKAAMDRPGLMRLVPRRLSERARKLGNQRFLAGQTAEAVEHLDLAVRLHPANMRAWISYLAARYVPNLAMRILGEQARRRQAAMGHTAVRSESPASLQKTGQTVVARQTSKLD